MRYFLAIFALCVLATVGVLGFRGTHFRKPPLYIFPDMERQPKLRPQTANAFFDNGMSSRLPVAGTIARSQPIHVGEKLVYPWQDSPVTTGRVTGTTNFVELNPLPVTAELLQRGQQVFNINCAACHSKLGDGNGTPKRINAMAVVANLHDKRIVELADGELFNTISYGKGLMQGYAGNLPIQDRWAAIAYLRALQLSRLGSLDEVPEAMRGHAEEIDYERTFQQRLAGGRAELGKHLGIDRAALRTLDLLSRRTARGCELAASGGAMPYSLSLCRPPSLIQSVVQAGESTVRTFELRNPSRSSANSISSVIMFIAGHRNRSA